MFLEKKEVIKQFHKLEIFHLLMEFTLCLKMAKNMGSLIES